MKLKIEIDCSGPAFAGDKIESEVARCLCVVAESMLPRCRGKTHFSIFDSDENQVGKWTLGGDPNA